MLPVLLGFQNLRLDDQATHSESLTPISEFETLSLLYSWIELMLKAATCAELDGNTSNRIYLSRFFLRSANTVGRGSLAVLFAG